MHCKEVMSQEVQWIAPEENIMRTAELMAFHNLGFFPVCGSDGKPLGVITDRDIALRVTGKAYSPAQTRVAEVMTTPVQSVGPECPVAVAGELMTETGVSRLLVLSDDGSLEGVVSLSDLAIRGPGHTALKTARGIYVRETSEHPGGHPHPASDPTPEFFHGDRDTGFAEEMGAENTARIEAQVVVSGNNNELKEFP
jgi:CBS domain-containing protein